MELNDQAISELCKLIADTLKVPREKIDLDSSPLTLPEWDSFHHVQLMVAVEDQYKIELDGEELATMISVGEIARVLREKGVVAA